MATSPSPYKRPAWMFIIILLVFAIPLFIAWLGWEEHDNFGRGTTNHGQLIIPPLDLSQLALSNEHAQAVDPGTWRGRWLLLYLNPQTGCNDQCEKSLYYLRQIRTATGKNSDRVQRAILTFSAAETDQKLQTLLSQDFSGTLQFSTTPKSFENFVHETPQAMDVSQKGGIYLVDPLGNVMMYYPNNTDPMGIFKDLTRLLKLSHIG